MIKCTCEQIRDMVGIESDSEQENKHTLKKVDFNLDDYDSEFDLSKSQIAVDEVDPQVVERKD